MHTTRTVALHERHHRAGFRNLTVGAEAAAFSNANRLIRLEEQAGVPVGAAAAILASLGLYLRRVVPYQAGA